MLFRNASMGQLFRPFKSPFRKEYPCAHCNPYRTCGRVSYSYRATAGLVQSPCLADEYVLNFDGIGSYADTGKVASVLGLGGNAPRTITTWVYTRAFNGAAPYQFGTLACTNLDFSNRTLSNNRWRIEYYCTYYDVTIDTANKWVHFAHVFDRSGTRYYANGQLIVDWSSGGINTADGYSLAFGRWGTAYFNGMVDDIRLYNRALTETEVQTVFCSGDIIDGLMSYWPFNEGTGATSADVAGGKRCHLRRQSNLGSFRPDDLRPDDFHPARPADSYRQRTDLYRR